MSKNKAQYKVTNWREYNKSLIARGSLTLWISEETVIHWYSNQHNGKRGSPNTYSNHAIELCLNLRYLFKLPLRATKAS